MVSQGYEICLVLVRDQYHYYLAKGGKRTPLSKQGYDGTIKCTSQARLDITRYRDRIDSRLIHDK